MKTFVENRALQEDLATRLNKVAWHGHYFTSLCPFHDNQDTPAFFVYPDGYRCMSCGVYGSLDRLQHHLSGVRTRYQEGKDEVVNERPDWFGWKKKYNSYFVASDYASIKAENDPCLLHYLDERGLPSERMNFDGEVGYIDGWISFPVYNDRMVFVDWVVRSTPAVETNIKYATRPRLRTGEKFHLYTASWRTIEQSDVVYVPFGILDMWALHFCEMPTATGMTGKSYKIEWFNNIRKQIILIPDQGEEEDAHKFAKLLGWRGKVLELDYPVDCKDPCDLYSKFGKDALMDKIGYGILK